MKKLLITLLLGFMLIPITAPLVIAEDVEVAEDAGENSTRPYIPKPDFLPGPNSLDSSGAVISGEDTQNYVLNTTIPRVINIVLGLFGIGTFLAILFAAVTMLTAWGNEDKVSKAKKNLQYSILGFVMSLLAFAIVSIVVSLALPSENDESAFLDWIAPSAYAADDSEDLLNSLFPSETDLIENQGGTSDEPGRGVSIASGDLIEEVIPALVTNLMFAVGFLIFIGFMYGGVLMLIGRGNEEEVTKAKNIILYSAVALGLLGFGYAIVYGIATLSFEGDANSSLDDVYVELDENE
jgi:hypothetical protein